MTSQTKLQIPIDIQLKRAVLERLRRMGFTSLNEIIRAFLVQFSQGKMNIGFFQEPIEMLDEETEKGIGESLRDFERGDYITVDPSQGKDAITKALNSML